MPETGQGGLELQPLGPFSGSFLYTESWTRMIFKICHSQEWILRTGAGDPEGPCWVRCTPLLAGSWEKPAVLGEAGVKGLG